MNEAERPSPKGCLRAIGCVGAVAFGIGGVVLVNAWLLGENVGTVLGMMVVGGIALIVGLGVLGWLVSLVMGFFDR